MAPRPCLAAGDPDGRRQLGRHTRASRQPLDDGHRLGYPQRSQRRCAGKRRPGVFIGSRRRLAPRGGLDRAARRFDRADCARAGTPRRLWRRPHLCRPDPLAPRLVRRPRRPRPGLAVDPSPALRTRAPAPASVGAAAAARGQLRPARPDRHRPGPSTRPDPRRRPPPTELAPLAGPRAATSARPTAAGPRRLPRCRPAHRLRRPGTNGGGIRRQPRGRPLPQFPPRGPARQRRLAHRHRSLALGHFARHARPDRRAGLPV